MLKVAAFSALAFFIQISARALPPANQNVFRTSSTASSSNLAHQNDGDTLENSRQFDFAEWCQHSKAEFLKALHEGGADQWVMVMGNEAAGKSSNSDRLSGKSTR